MVARTARITATLRLLSPHFSDVGMSHSLVAGHPLVILSFCKLSFGPFAGASKTRFARPRGPRPLASNELVLLLASRQSKDPGTLHSFTYSAFTSSSSCRSTTFESLTVIELRESHWSFRACRCCSCSTRKSPAARVRFYFVIYA
jgi:hypothetical protein